MSNNHSGKNYSELVLGIDTSSANASFAIVNGNQTLANLKGDASVPHSKTFFAHVSELLRLAGVSLQDVHAFAAATGPGSFTGLRVGLAALKGLAHALGKPAIGVNSIDAHALTLKTAGEILVIIEAGRKEIYAGLRRIDESGDIEEIGIDRVSVLDEVLKSFGPFLTEKTLVVSECASEQILKACNLEADFRSSRISTAEAVAFHAVRILQTQIEFRLQPHYVRASDAEIKRKD